MMAMSTTSIGRKGEQWVQAWFEWQGYQTKGRNILTPYGEIDLWVTMGQRHYLIEVKTRRRMEGPPVFQGLTSGKIRRLKLIRSYMVNQGGEIEKSQYFYSFIVLTPSRFYWFPNVFNVQDRFAVCPYTV